jgi:cysteinyl-tRNA synthetase
MMKEVCESIIDAIGNTPLVRIRRLNPNKKVKILAKLESFNPGGSIKDRAALYMIQGAENRGELSRDKIILDATSGNTGIGLALIAAAKGYRLCLAMPESATEERKRILKAMGAELILTPASLGTDGAIEAVYDLLRKNPEKYYGSDQFNNMDNMMAHYYSTAEEIWRQTNGAVTAVIASLGTSGTAMGISMRLKEYKSDIKIIGVEPYLKHKIQGLKNMKESYRPGIFDKSRLDEKINVLDEDAFEMARKLAREEGIFVGMSSGAAVHVAIERAREVEEGVFVVICPDSGERYLSTELFKDKEQSTFQLYNALTKERNFFRPINPQKVLMHSCGPTAHGVPHIGNYRRFVVSDLVQRYLKLKGYKVEHIVNIIDLDDKSIKGAEQAGLDLALYTQNYADAFLRDVERLNIKRNKEYPKASETVDDMLALVEKLVDRGYAYEKLRSVYFDISKLDQYGCLCNVDLSRIKHGKTVDMDDYEKDSPGDFTLLKRSSLSELKRGIYFKSRWGNVRPSWHLECAAIALKYFGDVFDIHGGGTDILFPHCENVMAIGRALTGKPLANYWLNTDLVMVEGKKMSQSLGNTITIDDLEKLGYHGKEIRFFLLGVHYRKPLNFSLNSLKTAKNSLRKINGFIQRLLHFKPGEGYPNLDQLIYNVRQGFADAMDDDLNISGALVVLFEFLKSVGKPLSQGMLDCKDRENILNVMMEIDSILGIMNFKENQLPEDVRLLMNKRDALRKEGQWEESDAIRAKLLEMGFEVSDTPDGMRWEAK